MYVKSTELRTVAAGTTEETIGPHCSMGLSSLLCKISVIVNFLQESHLQMDCIDRV